MRVVVALLLLALVVVPPASALTYRQQRALQVAEAKWKRLPCDGDVIFKRAALDFDFTAEVAPPCTIVLNAPAIDTLIWPFYCSIVVHEVGHLLGIGHSPDPRSVMYPQPGTYWRCKHSWRFSASR